MKRIQSSADVDQRLSAFENPHHQRAMRTQMKRMQSNADLHGLDQRLSAFGNQRHQRAIRTQIKRIQSSADLNGFLIGDYPRLEISIISGPSELG